ncbi:hypothetical protein [Kineosporia babensis]|uniref:Uncharacterized protein n=1 Tax=Kineosporia babensis TaxID=499548 RepID=A0A9X1NGD7_9ACTN|nr:hypothetical protein [Kineosporia babensis]MCD5313321.1 hypothetical protein [Kineosporia babensis]
MPRKLHAGHYALIGLLVIWMLAGLITSGRWYFLPGVSFRFGENPVEESFSQGVGGPQGLGGSDGDRWEWHGGEVKTVKAEGFGSAAFTWTLWKLADDGSSDRDIWAFEHDGSASPQSLRGRPDPVVSKLLLQAPPQAGDFEFLDSAGFPNEQFTPNFERPGDGRIDIERGRFARTTGDQYAHYAIMFTTPQGEEPEFTPVQEVQFRSFLLGTRTCSTDGQGSCS